MNRRTFLKAAFGSLGMIVAPALAACGDKHFQYYGSQTGRWSYEYDNVDVDTYKIQWIAKRHDEYLRHTTWINIPRNKTLDVESVMAPRILNKDGSSKLHPHRPVRVTFPDGRVFNLYRREGQGIPSSQRWYWAISAKVEEPPYLANPFVVTTHYPRA